MMKLQKIAITMQNKGQVLVLVAVSLVVLLALAALATDVGIAYSIKAKLNAAVDGAAIAAGRGVKQGLTDPQRIANAQTAATTFFNSNYPTGYMGSTLASGPTTTAVHNADGSWTINVEARANPPRFFARALSLLQGGWGQMTVRASAETTVRDLDLILVLDCSGSLGPPTSPSTTFPQLKSAAINFVNRFDDGPGGDRVGLVTFSSGAVLDVAIDKTAARGFNKTTVTNAINALSVGGATASAEGMRRAKVELDEIPANLRSSLRVIVFFSDGAPNMVSGTFCNNGAQTCSGSAVRRGDLYSDTVSGGPAFAMWDRTARNTSQSNATAISFLPNNDLDLTLPGTGTMELNGYRPLLAPISNTRCNVNRAARNMVENMANLARSGSGTDAITVYSLGLGARLNSLEITFCGYGTNEHGTNILKRLANTSDADTHNTAQPTGLYVFAANAGDLDAAFQTIANQILRITK